MLAVRSARSRASVGLVARGAWCAVPFMLACGDDSARPTQATESEPLAARCELPHGGYVESCNECLAARCCEPIEACKGSADCGEQLDCMLSCQDSSDPPGCSRACLAAGRHPDYVAYDDCSFADCRSQCWL